MNEKTKEYMKEKGMIFDSQVRFLTTAELKNKAFDFMKDRLDYLLDDGITQREVEEKFMDYAIDIFDFIDFVEKR